MNVVVIMRNDTESWSGRSSFVAVALDQEAALAWIQDEVDEKHGGGHQYMQGKPAEWWIQYGTFSLVPTEVHRGVR